MKALTLSTLLDLYLKIWQPISDVTWTQPMSEGYQGRRHSRGLRFLLSRQLCSKLSVFGCLNICAPHLCSVGLRFSLSWCDSRTLILLVTRIHRWTWRSVYVRAPAERCSTLQREVLLLIVKHFSLVGSGTKFGAW